MKKLLAAISVALLVPVSAAQAENMYVSIDVGANIPADADWSGAGNTGEFGLETGVAFAGALGMRFNDNIRAELELSYREVDVDSITQTGVGSMTLSGELETTALLLNGYYDFMPNANLSPYVSGGLGMAWHDGTLGAAAGYSPSQLSADDSVFAYQVGFGVAYGIMDKTDLTLGYRYFGTSDPGLSGFEAEYDSSEIMLGIDYSF